MKKSGILLWLTRHPSKYRLLILFMILTMILYPYKSLSGISEFADDVRRCALVTIKHCRFSTHGISKVARHLGVRI
jgi:hypothetical protein